MKKSLKIRRVRTMWANIAIIVMSGSIRHIMANITNRCNLKISGMSNIVAADCLMVKEADSVVVRRGWQFDGKKKLAV